MVCLLLVYRNSTNLYVDFFKTLTLLNSFISVTGFLKVNILAQNDENSPIELCAGQNTYEELHTVMFAI